MTELSHDAQPLLPPPPGRLPTWGRTTNNLDPATISPFSFDEFRAIARSIAYFSFLSFDNDDLAEADFALSIDTCLARHISLADREELLLRVMNKEIPLLRDGETLDPLAALHELGGMGQAALFIANTVTVLLYEADISFSPVATGEEKELARYCKERGFDALRTQDFEAAEEYAAAVATVLSAMATRSADSQSPAPGAAWDS